MGTVTGRYAQRITARVAGIGIILMALMGLVTLPASAAGLTEAAKRTLLAKEWQELHRLLAADEAKAADPLARWLAAHAAVAMNRNNEATALFLSLHKTDPDALLSWARDVIRQHKTAIAHYLYGDALARAGSHKEAVEAFSSAVALEPGLALAWSARGVAKTQIGVDAEGDLSKATELEPGLASLHANLGTYWVLERVADGAKAAFEEALRLDPDFALAHIGLGCALYGKGLFDQAASHFETASAFPPTLALAQANQSWLLAAAFKQVEKQLRAEGTPGMSLKSEQRVVIDIPGAETQGERRPESWAPFLAPGSQRINIRHEGELGTNLQRSEPGLTITMPRNATAAEVEARLQPLFDRFSKGESLFIKLDANVKLGGHLSTGKPGEQQWVGAVGDLIASRLKGRNPDAKLVLNTHSWGTESGRTLNLSFYNQVVFSSPRNSPDRFSRLADQYPGLPITIITADRDLPHGFEKGFMSLNQSNVTVINLESGSLFPSAVHSQIADGFTKGRFAIKTAQGTQRLEGTLGDLAMSNAAPVTDYTRPGVLDERLAKYGPAAVQQEMIAQRDRLMQALPSLQQALQGNNRAIGRWNGAIMGIELFNVGQAVSGLTQAGLKGWGPFVKETYKQGATEGGKMVLEHSDTSLSKGLQAGLSAVGSGPIGAVLGAGGYLAGQGAETARDARVASQLRMANEARRLALEVGLLSSKIREVGRMAADAPASNQQLSALPPPTGLLTSTSHSPAAIPALARDLLRRPSSGPVLVIGDDSLRSPVLASLLHRGGRDVLLVPPMDQRLFTGLTSGRSFSSIVGVRTEDTSKMSPLPPPGCPPFCGGGGGAAIPSGTSALTRPPSGPPPSPSYWGFGKPFTPSSSGPRPGGISTKELAWTYIDTGDWPVSTVFLLGYAPAPLTVVSAIEEAETP